ncbi:MAG TPA: MerR family transcriptional regulator [Clostridiales bacterium]|nr:MerR family transcriptional regulator [Clostridiales bacterium]
MLINEVSKATNLTKKAIEYYAGQALISPSILNNGYRDFNEATVGRLKKISVLRKLGLNTEEIRSVLADETNSTLKRLSVQKELTLQKEQAKKTILDQLSSGKDYAELSKALDSIDQNTTIAEKLLEAFPGYYGRFICLHFASFLNEPITTEEQKAAYQDILAFLDNVPPFNFPPELQDYLNENTEQITTDQITGMLKNTRKSIENPEKFLSENKEFLEHYWTYMQSEEYKSSPAYKLGILLKEFNSSNGYYDIFIPAMKKLSPSYASYYRQSEIASEKILAQYPEM